MDDGQKYNERLLLYRQESTNSREEIKGSISDYRESMRNYSLALGAIAAASLASLGLPIPKIVNLIILGSVLLIAMVFICFLHLINDANTEIRASLKYMRSLKPLEDVVSGYEKLQLGKITREEFEKLDADFEKSKKDFLEKGRDFSTNFAENHDETYILVGTAIGLLIVVSGFLIRLYAPSLASILG